MVSCGSHDSSVVNSAAMLITEQTDDDNDHPGAAAPPRVSAEQCPSAKLPPGGRLPWQVMVWWQDAAGREQTACWTSGDAHSEGNISQFMLLCACPSSLYIYHW